MWRDVYIFMSVINIVWTKFCCVCVFVLYFIKHKIENIDILFCWLRVCLFVCLFFMCVRLSPIMVHFVRGIVCIWFIQWNKFWIGHWKIDWKFVSWEFITMNHSHATTSLSVVSHNAKFVTNVPAIYRPPKFQCIWFCYSLTHTQWCAIFFLFLARKQKKKWMEKKEFMWE